MLVLPYQLCRCIAVSRGKTHNIETSDELAVHPELGVRGPLGELLEALSHLVVGQDVEEAVLDAALAQEGDELPREAALRAAGRALHEQHDGGGLDQLAQPLEQLLLGLGRVGAGIHLVGSGGGPGGGGAVSGSTFGLAPGVGLDGGADLDGAAAADGLEDGVVALQDQVGDGGHVVELGDVAQLLGVERDPARLRRLGHGVLGGEGAQDRGHLGAGRGPGRVERDDEEGVLVQAGDVGAPLILVDDLLYRGHFGWLTGLYLDFEGWLFGSDCCVNWNRLAGCEMNGLARTNRERPELFRRLRLRIAGRMITIHWPCYRSNDPTIARHIVPTYPLCKRVLACA